MLPQIIERGIGTVVECDLPKVKTRVRFPHPALEKLAFSLQDAGIESRNNHAPA